jgi:hypothetical protein
LQYVPRVIVTDQLRSYHAAKEEIMPSVQHRQDKGQQPGREFASANQVAGACDEAIQISRSGAAFSLSLRDHYLTLPSGETSVQSYWLSGSDEIEIRPLGRGDLRRGRCLLRTIVN